LAVEPLEERRLLAVAVGDDLPGAGVVEAAAPELDPDGLTVLVAAGAGATVLVPPDDTLGDTWQASAFDDSPQQYEAATDVTDARILARHLEWAASESAAADQAFNIVNGDIFRWRMWKIVADGLGVEAADYPGKPTPLVEQMTGAGSIWNRIVAKHDLQPYPVETLASWWHSDADLGRTIETFTDMSKSRRLGFLDYQETSASFLDLFDRLRAERIIPPRG